MWQVNQRQSSEWGVAVVAVAVLLGMAIGFSVRLFPETLAGALVRLGYHPSSCGIEAAAECAIREAPAAIGWLIVYGVMVLGVAAAAATAGIVVPWQGVASRHRSSTRALIVVILGSSLVALAAASLLGIVLG